MKTRFAILAGMVAVLVACTTVPVASIPKLRKIDIETTDIAALRVIVKSPEVVDFLRKPIKITVATEMDGEKNEVAANLSWGSPDADDAAMAANLSEEGYNVEVFRIPANKISEFNNLRDKSIASRDAGAHGSTSGGFDLSGACLLRETDEPLLVQVFVKTSETGQYVHAMRNIDYREEVRKAGIADMEICS